jgi:hypothetical protein
MAKGIPQLRAMPLHSDMEPRPDCYKKPVNKALRTFLSHGMLLLARPKPNVSGSGHTFRAKSPHSRGMQQRWQSPNG